MNYDEDLEWVEFVKRPVPTRDGSADDIFFILITPLLTDGDGAVNEELWTEEIPAYAAYATRFLSAYVDHETETFEDGWKATRWMLRRTKAVRDALRTGLLRVSDAQLGIWSREEIARRIEAWQ